MIAALIDGTNDIEVNVYDRAAAGQGVGPILSCLSAEYGYELGRSTRFSATFPLADPRTDLLVTKSHIVEFVYQGHREFRGVIEAREVTVSGTGELLLSIEGRDMTAELAEAPVGFLQLTSGAAGVNDGPEQILDAVNTFKGTTWALDTVNGFATTSTAVYAKFAGESGLQALVKVAERIGEQWRVATDGSRKIVWLRAGTLVSGLRAVQGVDDPIHPLSPDVCIIQSFGESEQAYGVYNTIFPFGSGIGGSRLTLLASNRTPPAGFTMDVNADGDYFIANDDAVAIDAPSGKYVEFKDIRPVSNTNAHLQSAANALFDAALAWLQRSDTVADQKTYTLTAIGVPPSLTVGTTLRVEYVDDRYEVNDHLVVLGIRHQVGQSGAKLTTLTVSAVSTWPAIDGDIVAADMEQGKVFTSHPQSNANSYTTNYRVFVGYDQSEHKGDVRFWFGGEIMQLHQVLARVHLGQLVDTSVTVGGSAAVEIEVEVEVTTDDHTHTVPDHDHDTGASWSNLSGAHDLYVFDNGALTYGGSDVGPIAISTTDTEGSVTTPGGEGSASGTGSGTGTVDLSGAISSEFGLFKSAALDTFSVNGVEWQVNGLGWNQLSAATALGGDFYLLDLTPLVSDDIFRPTDEDNLLEFRHNRRAISSVSGNGTTVTVNTSASHGLATGQKVTISGTTNYNGTWTVAVTDADTFTFAHTATPGETTGAVAIHKTAMLDVLLTVVSSVQAVVIS